MCIMLDGIHHPMCPRFHTDKLKCCLVTPYVDPITKWIPHHLVIRSKLRYWNEGKPNSESGLYVSENDIKQLYTRIKKIIVYPISDNCSWTAIKIFNENGFKAFNTLGWMNLWIGEVVNQQSKLHL